MPRFPKRIPIDRFQVEVLAYEANVITAGGTVSLDTKRALDKFVRDMKEANLYSKLTECGVICGSNLAAAAVKLVHSGQYFSTNVNFVGGDYVERGSSGGLNGDGTTKYMSTAYTATGLTATGHMAAYLRNDVVAGGNRMLLGAMNPTDQFWLGGLNAPSTADARWGNLNATSNLTGVIKGFWHNTRLSSADMRLFRNGTLMDQTTAATTHVPPAVPIFTHAVNSNGTPAGYVPGRISFWSFGASMTSPEAVTYNTIVQALQANLNRNV